MSIIYGNCPYTLKKNHFLIMSWRFEPQNILPEFLLDHIDIHQEYKSFATEMHYRSVSFRTFKSHIQIVL
jgi:hypothetical protein